MELIISHSIRKREFGETVPTEDLAILRRAARPALAVPIKGKDLPPGTRLLKAYATSPRGVRRVVFLLAVQEGDLFLLFFRDKNDPVGANLTIANPDFRRELHKHLDLLAADLRNEAWDRHII